MSKTSKENKRVSKCFEDLKEGMKVYIRDDLRGGVNCGGNAYVSDMVKGLVEFDDFEPEDSVSSESGRKYKYGYRYTNEMIDWDKTNELNGISKYEPNQPTQSNFIKLPQVKVVNSDLDNHLLYGTFIQVDDKTVIYVDDNRTEAAHCHPDDEFNLEVGKALAYYRWMKGE